MLTNKSRLAAEILLYFYQGDLTQEDADTVVDAFKGKSVHFRKVHDINDTRDLTERCVYAAGTVPLIYFVRKSADVLTGGVLSDPLNRPNASAATSDGKGAEALQVGAVVVNTGHMQPTDANIAASLLKEEIEQIEQKTEEPDIKATDVKVDATVPSPSSVTGQVTTPVAPVAPAKPVAPVAVKK